MFFVTVTFESTFSLHPFVYLDEGTDLTMT